MAPSVTVVMPYWRTPTIGRAVGSLLAQTFTDWRLVVVEDGESAPPLPNDPRIERLHLSNNRGFSNALAEGLDVSDGEWWTGHDADDWSEPHRLATLVAAIGDRDAVLAPVVEWRRDGSCRVRPVVVDGARQAGLVHVGWHQAGLYRTSVARNVGWRRDVRYAYDSVFVGLVVSHHNPVVIDEPMYHLVRRSGSLTTKRRSDEYQADRLLCAAEWEARR